MQHEPMSIQVRPKEPQCTITLTKGAWLSFLVWLVEYSEQAATEDIDKVVQQSITLVRGVVLSKGLDPEHSLNLERLQALDLYIHTKDFNGGVKDEDVSAVLKTITGQLKEFLLGGKSG